MKAWCDICGGNFVDGSCPEHGSNVQKTHLGVVKQSAPINRLGGTGRELTAAEMKLINDPWGKR